MRKIQCTMALLALFFSQNFNAQGQALPIAIDSRFDDWAGATSLTDAQGDGFGIDFLRFEVANDEEFLFLQLQIVEEVNLTDNNEITLYLDTDQNANTGEFKNGIGAELTIIFGDREASYQLPSGSGFMDLSDLEWRHQPTVTGSRWEIAIDRQALSNAGFPLFTGPGVRLFWKDEDGTVGDQMPESGTVFTYVFDETPTTPFEPIPLEKESPDHLRILTWNTLSTGLDDLDRQASFDRVLGVLQPDIVTFNECWDMNAPQVATFMNGALPIGNFQSWKAVKLDQGNVTASRWPILQSWLIYPGHRLTASLIDLPDDVYGTDILVINAHFKCCGDGDFDRQREADAFVKFILDAKTPGGVIDLPEGTPFILSGDLNLVGKRQQLTTLLTGDIVNNGLFGPDGALDWDGGDLTDVISLQADQRMAFTWDNPFSSFPTSRIDFQIISGSTAEVEKAYTLNTRAMSAPRLAENGLQFNDTRNASDHLPKVTDLQLALPTPVSETDFGEMEMDIFPNPTHGQVSARFHSNWAGTTDFVLQNAAGQRVAVFEKEILMGENTLHFELGELPAGVYFLVGPMAGRFIRS